MDIHYFLWTVHLVKYSLHVSGLKERKFRHGFTDTINPMCGCGAELETTEHFLHRCNFYSTKDLNSSIILKKLNQTLKTWVIKIKPHLCYTFQKQILLKILIKTSSKL